MTNSKDNQFQSLGFDSKNYVSQQLNTTEAFLKSDLLKLFDESFKDASKKIESDLINIINGGILNYTKIAKNIVEDSKAFTTSFDLNRMLDNFERDNKNNLNQVNIELKKVLLTSFDFSSVLSDLKEDDNNNLKSVYLEITKNYSNSLLEQIEILKDSEIKKVQIENLKVQNLIEDIFGEIQRLLQTKQ